MRFIHNFSFSIKRFSSEMYFIVKQSFMLRKYLTALVLISLVSCGKDVVIIDEPITPIETENLFEVNLVGFVTDEERTYISDGSVAMDGITLESDQSGFFHFEEVLIGERGKIVEVEKEGLLPTVYRIANHQSLENVVLNLQMIDAPENVSISNSGGTIESGFSVMNIPKNSVEQTTDMIFKSFIGSDANLGNSDPLYFGQTTEYLLKEASFYIDGSSPLSQNFSLEISTDINQLNSIEDLSVYYYDKASLSWKRSENDLIQTSTTISFNCNAYGWWTIARNVPAQYSNLQLDQINGVAISGAESKVSFGDNEYNAQVYYTSTSGTISTYFPLEKRINISMDNGTFKEVLPSGFSKGITTESIEFDAEVQSSFEGKVYACDFSLSDGVVAIVSEGQHKITTIENGHFLGEVFSENETLTLQFYSNEYEFLSDKQSSLEELKNEANNFLSCSDLNDNLTLLNGENLFQDFDMCRVKVRPKETVVIGERSNGDVFLVSFNGEKEGMYDGLIYFPLITDSEVKSDVSINIVLFDEEKKKVGGFIKTEYTNTGQELTISFIGDIE